MVWALDEVASRRAVAMVQVMTHMDPAPAVVFLQAELEVATVMTALVVVFLQAALEVATAMTAWVVVVTTTRPAALVADLAKMTHTATHPHLEGSALAMMATSVLAQAALDSNLLAAMAQVTATMMATRAVAARRTQQWAR